MEPPMSNEEIFRLIRNGQEGRNEVAKFFMLDDRLNNGVKKVMTSIKPGWFDHEFREVFDTMIMLFEKKVLTDHDFKIEKNRNSYLFMIARNSYLKMLSDQDPLFELPEDFELTSEEAPVESVIENSEVKEMLEDLFDKVGEGCKEVLFLWAQGFSMEEIREKLDKSTEGNVRKKKHDCIKKVQKYLDDHPGLKDMLR